MRTINKKVKNATPIEKDGIKFRSKLEAYTYDKLKEYNLSFNYESERFDLIPSFLFNGKKIRPATYLPDFVGSNFIIECKGYRTDSWPLREKLFKYKLFLTQDKRQFFIVHNKKEVEECIKKIQNP